MDEHGTVLITGAGGFIGGRLTEALHLGTSYDVRPNVRQWSSAARISRLSVEPVLFDVMDRSAIRRGLRGATHVVHCAYGPPDVTIEGTRNVLEVAHEVGVDRFVHFSTVDVYDKNVEGEVDEDQPLTTNGDRYGDMKVKAERVCWRMYEDESVPVTVLRPSIVYGPFSELWTVNMCKRVKSGRWGTLGAYGEGLCNLVYIDDVVQAVRRSLVKDEAVGEAFNVNGPQAITWNEYFRRINSALDRAALGEINPTATRLKAKLTAPVRSIAQYLLEHFEETIMSIYTRFDLAKKLMKMTESGLKTTPTTSELQLFQRDAHYSNKKAQRLLKYSPQFEPADGIGASTKWLRHHGY